MGWFFQRRKTEDAGAAANVVHLDPDVLGALESRRGERPLAEFVNALLRESVEEQSVREVTPARSGSKSSDRALPFWLEKEHAAHVDTPDDELRKRVTERRMSEPHGTE